MRIFWGQVQTMLHIIFFCEERKGQIILENMLVIYI